jgi:hypothetical protein
MTQKEAIDFARAYLWDESCFKDHKQTPHDKGGKNVIRGGLIDDYHLHGSLQSHLCQAYARLVATFGEGEVNKKDIAHIVEAWKLSSRLYWEQASWKAWYRVSDHGIIEKTTPHPTAHKVSEHCPSFEK